MTWCTSVAPASLSASASSTTRRSSERVAAPCHVYYCGCGCVCCMGVCAVLTQVIMRRTSASYICAIQVQIFQMYKKRRLLRSKTKILLQVPRPSEGPYSTTRVVDLRAVQLYKSIRLAWCYDLNLNLRKLRPARPYV